MCLRWNRTHRKGRHCRMKWNHTWKNQHIWCSPSQPFLRPDRSEPKLMCKLQSYESSPKRCCDSHRHTCESQFPLCFLLVVQELEDVLNLLLERARLRARRSALGLSCCGPQPGGWYLAPTHCCWWAAVGQEEAAKHANIPVSLPAPSSACTWETQRRNSCFRQAVRSQQVSFAGHWTWFSSL